MAIPEQISAHSAIDTDGFVLQGQLYVPAAAVQSTRATYGVDETSDAAGNHYAAPAVTDHIPINQAHANIFYAAGSAAGANNLSLGAPGAGFVQYVAGFMASARLATAAQDFSVELSGTASSVDRLWLAMKTADTEKVVVIFRTPIPASAANTAIVLVTTFTGVTTARVDVSIWGFNRAV